MSYGIIRMQKFKAPGVRGIQSHDLRERESHTNPDIDQGRKAENYALVDCPGFNQAIRERLESLESDKAVRKDAVVMCQMLVTSDSEFFKNLTPEKEKEFFLQSLDFIGKRYGHENIISAIVHKDEKTPHMHVNFVPVKDNKLSAYAIFGKKTELQNLQTDFHRDVGQAWGLERGQSREDKRRHLTVEQFKHKTAMEAMEKERDAAAAELARTRADVEQARAELARFEGVREGTARAMAQAQAWSMEKARKEVERREKERERQAALEKAKAEREAEERLKEQARPSRGPRMGR